METNKVEKYSKGPWRIASKNFDTGFYVINANDYSSNTQREFQVVKLHSGSHPIKEHLQRIEADAKLISKAPELVEAIKKLLNSNEHLELDLDSVEYAEKLLNELTTTK